MVGVLFSVIAGVLISLQSVFNTRISEKIGMWETTAFIHVIGLSFASVMVFFAGTGSFKKIPEINILYIIGGTFGVIIIFSAVKSIIILGPTYSIAILLITQLIIASIIEYYGLFGVAPIRFTVPQILGLITMVIGIVIFKLK